MRDKPREYICAGQQDEVARLEAQAKAFGRVLEKEFEAMNLTPNTRVLDAGCGTGAVTRRLAMRVFPEEVFGVDIDPVFVKAARKLAVKDGVKNVEFEQRNIDRLRFQDDSFNLSYCRLVLMHVNNPVDTVTELKRVTKTGGAVAVSDIDDGAMLTYPPAPAFFDAWSKFGQLAASRGENRYIGRELYSILAKAGLSHIRIHPFPIHATKQNPEVLKALVSVPLQILQSEKDAMIREGVIKAKDYEVATKEASQILKHPGAFALGLSFLAVGKVP